MEKKNTKATNIWLLSALGKGTVILHSGSRDPMSSHGSSLQDAMMWRQGEHVNLSKGMKQRKVFSLHLELLLVEETYFKELILMILNVMQFTVNMEF